jgi:carbon starvation protein
MNSAVIGAFTIAWLVAAYFTYGRHIRRRLIEPEDVQATPAEALRDDVDFKPANPFVLFGHHFSSIAGAGPIVGPILAVAFFGWGASLAWILLAVVMMGAVHDYLSLMVSVRHGGRSIPDIAREVVGNRSRMLFQVFVLVTLILVIAAFIDVASRSFLDKPEIVLPSLGLIPLAMVFGWAVYRRGVSLVAATSGALLVLAGMIAAGDRLPIALHVVVPEAFPDAWVVTSLGLSANTARTTWHVVLALYGLMASVMPVWFLLQPRDFLANWILMAGMALGFTGLFVSHKPVTAEVFTSSMTAQGPVWPMLFILIACGAISGFHSLVAGGTTAKQLARERHALRIGFGGMLTEGALAVMALLAVAAGLTWGELQQMVVQPNGAGAIVAFGTGFGRFVDPLIGATAGVFFGITMINAFVMTTLDTTVRLSRFMVGEMVGSRFPAISNRWVASLVAVVPAFLLVSTGGQNTIWPMFAASNQLVAGLTLIVLSAYFVGRGKPAWYTLGPAIVMLITTMAALSWQSWRFLVAFDPAKGPNLLLGGLAIVLLVLSVVVAVDAVRIMRGRARKAH